MDWSAFEIDVIQHLYSRLATMPNVRTQLDVDVMVSLRAEADRRGVHLVLFTVGVAPKA